MRGSTLFIIMILLGASCLEPADCVQRRNNQVGVAFKSLENGQAVTQTIDTLYAEGANMQIIAPGNYGSVILPLDYTNDTTVYKIEIADTTYSLVLAYRSKIEFVNNECGEKFVLSGLEIAEHDFDSVRVINRTPGVDENAANVEIFK